MHPVEGIANHRKWPKHNDEIWYNKVEWSCLLTLSHVEAGQVLDRLPSRTLKIYNMIDWYVYMIYFIVLLFFETFLQTFKTLGEMCHIWDILVFFVLWVEHFGK